jgi:hypothetical protein
MTQLPPPESQSPHELPKASRRHRWLAIVLAVVIFLSGFVIGSGTAVVFIHNHLINAVRYPNQAADRIAERLRRSLDLTDSQAAQVKAIIHKRQTALQDIRRRVQPEVEAQLDLVEREVSDVLEPQQQKKWHEMLEHLRTTWLPPTPPPSGSEQP